MSYLTPWVPKPLKDIAAPLLEKSSLDLAPQKKMVKTAARVALLAAGALALTALGFGANGALAVGVLTSLPATSLALGGLIAYKGLALTAGAISTGSIAKAVLLGLVTWGGSSAILNRYDWCHFGFMEKHIDRFAEWGGNLIGG